MADAWRTFPIEFNGGLITNLSPLQQGINAPGSATVLRNFEPSIEGGYRRIKGYSKFDSDALSGSGIVRGVARYAGYTIAARGTHLYRSIGSGWTQITDNSTFSSSGTTLSGSDRVRFAKYNFDGNENLFVVDGNAKPYIFDSTASTFTQLTSLSSDFTGCEFVAEYKNHIFTANGENLFFSAPYEDDDFSTANGGGVINVGAVINDLVVFREQLIIFTETSIKRLVGNSVVDFVLQPITEDLGAVRPDTVQEVGGDVVFLGPDGIRTLAATDRIGDFNLSVLSKNIQNEVTGFTNAASHFTSVTIRGKSQYRIFGYTDGIQDSSAQGVVATQIGNQQFAWAETRGINARVSFSEYEDDEEVILFANDNGYVYQLESGNSFDGSDISATYYGPFLPLDDPQIRKTFYKATMYTDPTGAVSMSLRLVLDLNRKNTGIIQPSAITLANDTSAIFTFGGSDPVPLYGTATYSSNDVDSFLTSQLIGSGFNASIQITTEDTNPPFALDSLVLEYAVNGRR